MATYDFSTLNDKEFEQICKDLLNAQFNLGLQDFKGGKDKGIDLRHSTSKNNNAIVVQAKQYIRSGYAQLKSTFKNKELKKVIDLKPDRYIVATSLSLSAQEKDELKEILKPWVLNSNDILGQEDLNDFLSKNYDIEIKYFKLWFSSVNVFNAILNNAIEGRTKYLFEIIQKNIPYYVITKKFDEANKILQKEKLLLITGQPGIGKTTLAETLLMERAKNGVKIYKVENIREAEDVLSVNNDEKQLFYFDDFLGASYVEIINPQRTETQLTSFVERIKNTPNKYLILTTRTVLLNQAIEKYEKINNSKIANNKFEIKLADYTKLEKAQILYNHLFFKDVKEELFESILNEKFYFNIIKHKNYTPRIIEFITDKSKINSFTSDQYLEYIISNLNNPKDIWRHSYNNQIEYFDRCLLITLFSFEGPVLEKHLIESFEVRLNYERTNHNQIINTNQFIDSLRILLNGFISSEITDIQKEIRLINLLNPSLIDFFIGNIAESYQERKNIIYSFVYLEQLRRFNPDKSILPFEKDLQLILRDRISENKYKLIESEKQYFTDNHKYAIVLEILCKYCHEVNIDSVLLYNLKQLDFKNSFTGIVSKINFVLESIEDSPLSYDYIKANFYLFIDKILTSTDDIEISKNIPILFKKYEFDYDAYIESEEGTSKLIDLIENVLQSNEVGLIDDKKNSVTNNDELAEIYDELDDIEKDLMGNLFPNSYISYDFGIKPEPKYWEDKIKENMERIAHEEAEADGQMDYYKDFQSSFESEENAIDDLFVKHE